MTILMLVTSIQSPSLKYPLAAFCMPGALWNDSIAALIWDLRHVSTDRLHNFLQLRKCWSLWCVKPHSHCAPYCAARRVTAQYGAEPRSTALIDYMEINRSIHTESSTVQYCAACCALIALGAIRTVKCSAV